MPDLPDALSPADVATLGASVLDEVERAVVGKRDVLELVLMTLLADGHLLIEDYPGLAKTLTVRAFAHVTDLRFSRVQFTPDLTPMDVTGSAMFDQRSGDLVFRPGPVFTHLLLADEVNRAPAKTQAALLECMQERQVTADGVTHRLDRPFLVVATQNPIEYEGTYPLPEAQLDRFLARTGIGYPDPDDEWDVLQRRVARGHEEVRLDVIVDRSTLLAMQQAVERVHVDADVGRYAVALVGATRQRPAVRVGASPRGSLALAQLARARAVLDGRDFVLPDDVKAVAVPALAHRLVLRPELWISEVRGEDVVAECLAQVPVPPVRPRDRRADSPRAGPGR